MPKTKKKIEKIVITANHFKTLWWGIKLGRILGFRLQIKIDHTNKGENEKD